MRHASFIARTVLVQNNDIEAACRVLNRILGREGIFDQFRRTRYYEKPYQVKNCAWKLKYCYNIYLLHYSCVDVLISKGVNLFIMRIWIGKFSLFYERIEWIHFLDVHKF